MGSIHQVKAALDITARTKKLPSGDFVGYIEHRTGDCVAAPPESYIAGVFDNADSARAAAVRMMQTFRSTVIEPAQDEGEADSGP